MLTPQEISLFALTALVLVLTPGPNMILAAARISASPARSRGWLALDAR